MKLKRHVSKPVRVWVLGSALCATIFLALSANYDFWAMKTMKNTVTKSENTTYFGLWRTCYDYKHPIKNNSDSQITQSVCQDFGVSGHIGITGTPAFIKLTRAFLIMFVVIMGITTIITAIVMFTTNRALLYWSSPFSLTGSIVGIIVLGIFLGEMCNTDMYKDYDMAWSFYYCLIGWFFALSSFATALLDRPLF